MTNKPICLCHINLSKNYRGGERQTELSILESLKSKYFSVIAILRKNGALAHKLKYTRNLTIIEVSSALDGHFRVHSLSPSVLHAHDGNSPYWCFVHFLLFSTPYIITRRVDHALNTNFVTKSTYSSAKYTVGISHNITNQLKSFSSVVTTISSVTETPPITNSIRPLSINSLFMAGALVDSHKGQTIAIDALKACADSITLDIYGDGPDRDFLLNYISMHKLSDRVKIYPWPHNLSMIVEKYDAFIMSSRYEGLGSILIDIMKMKRLIIASDAGGIPDLITNGSTGLLFEKNNAKSLSKQIALANTSIDIKKITDTAFEFAQGLTPENMQKQYEKIYSKVLTENPV